MRYLNSAASSFVVAAALMGMARNDVKAQEPVNKAIVVTGDNYEAEFLSHEGPAVIGFFSPSNSKYAAFAAEFQAFAQKTNAKVFLVDPNDVSNPLAKLVSGRAQNEPRTMVLDNERKEVACLVGSQKSGFILDWTSKKLGTVLPKPKNIIEVTEENFQTALADQGPKIIDFWATWCGPCVTQKPVLESFARANPSVTVYTIDISDGAPEDVQKLLEELNPKNEIPTMGVYNGGVRLSVRTGGTSAEALANDLKLQPAIGNDTAPVGPKP